MKKIAFFLFLVALVFVLSGCILEEDDPLAPIHGGMTFEEVSQPYLDQYGQPEDVYEYKTPDYWSIEWWWWSQGFEVTFLWTTYDDIYGWVVDSTYSSPPF